MKNELFEKYGLTAEDYVVTQDGAVIVKRTGIKKIRAKEKMIVTYEIAGCGSDWTTVIASGWVNGEETLVNSKPDAQAIGSATPRNCDFNFMAETAEYRAESRVVLELIGMKEMNVFSESEYQIDNEIKKKTESLASKTSEISRTGDFTAYVFRGEHKGLLMDISQFDDEHYILGETAVSIEDAMKWNKAEHSYMRDDRSASDVKKIVKLLGSKGVTKESYSGLAVYPKMVWVDFISKAPLIQILEVISNSIENK